MDYNAFKLLTEKERYNFEEWYKKSSQMSMDELFESYKDWLTKTKEAYAKYVNQQPVESAKDVSAFSSMLVYLLLLTTSTWNSLDAYTTKLQQEYNLLKKKPARRKKKVGV